MAWTAPSTWVAGLVTSTMLNTQIRDNFKAIGDPWQSYAPTFTNLTLGASTVTGNYMEAGKLVHARGSITLGTGFAITGTVQVSLPVTGNGPIVPLGQAGLRDVSAGAYRWWSAVANAANATSFFVADPSDTRVNATTPWTWAVGDVITWQLAYEAA